MKIKSLISSILCVGILLSNFQISNAKSIDSKNTMVYLTGNGIATRLHEPVLKGFPDVTTEFIHIPDETINATELNNNSEDWLFLGTPVYKHKQHLLYAVKKYKKILCEKPVGLSLDEINQIKCAINENQVLFRVDYALRFLPILEKIKEFANNNDIKSATIVCNANFNQNTPNKQWKNDYQLGGGVLYSILPHLIDLLNFIIGESDLSSINFESTSKIPMDDIKIFSKTPKGINTTIDINLCEDFDELKLEMQTANKVEVFDLIDSPTNIVNNTKYNNGTLPATSEISPWHTSFKCLLENIFVNPTDYRFAGIEDAENVHKVLNVILSKLKV